jgi:hypothetical protein
MSDYHSIQELGGAALARHYPDRGLIPESNWYNAILKVETTAAGWRGWLEWLVRGNQAFGAVLSANAEGLRILVLLDHFTIFIPWSDAAVDAERGWPATVVRLRTAAVPSLDLVFHLDDAAADDLFREVVPPLPPRQPPRQLAWWLAESCTAWVVLVTGVSAGLLLWLLLSRA